MVEMDEAVHQALALINTSLIPTTYKVKQN